MSVTAELDEARLRSKGLLLVVIVAVAAKFVSEHYGAPAMLFALLIGMAFNFLDDDERFAPGVTFASRTLLRIGVALLGFRLGLADIAALDESRGAPTALPVVSDRGVAGMGWT